MDYDDTIMGHEREHPVSVFIDRCIDSVETRRTFQAQYRSPRELTSNTTWIEDVDYT